MWECFQEKSKKPSGCMSKMKSCKPRSVLLMIWNLCNMCVPYRCLTYSQIRSKFPLKYPKLIDKIFLVCPSLISSHSPECWWYPQSQQFHTARAPNLQLPDPPGLCQSHYTAGRVQFLLLRPWRGSAPVPRDEEEGEGASLFRRGVHLKLHLLNLSFLRFLLCSSFLLSCIFCVDG